MNASLPGPNIQDLAKMRLAFNQATRSPCVLVCFHLEGKLLRGNMVAMDAIHESDFDQMEADFHTMLEDVRADRAARAAKKEEHEAKEAESEQQQRKADDVPGTET